ncbi:MAG: DNA-processing protein DprA [Lachnospiraceae bacterium]|nr:DNA-processing protein DprA [Lachnospiraceae bacterium]
MDTNSKYYYFMDCVKGVGPKTVKQLLSVLDGPKEAYEADFEQLAKIIGETKATEWCNLREHFDLEYEFAKLMKRGINFCCFLESDYPERLKRIPDPPLALYVKGSLPKESMRSVAVIGARRCSSYGKTVALEVGKALGMAGIQVISGMAMGIDGIAQEGAISAGGSTFGVLGCGVDICYPERHKDLYERMQNLGGVISSYKPGTMPKPEQFPPRNRIISGLSDGVVVVEAGEKSGTLITVDMALEQGREIYCVPGRITDRLSGGCNRLIDVGAHIVLSVDALLQKIQENSSLGAQFCGEADVALGQTKIQNFDMQKCSMDKIYKSMTNREKEVLKMLDVYPVSGEQIYLQLSAQSLYNWTFPEVLQTLWELVCKGLADNVNGSLYTKKSSY